MCSCSNVSTLYSLFDYTKNKLQMRMEAAHEKYAQKNNDQFKI